MLCMNTEKEEHASFILEGIKSQRDEDTLLTKELELLMAGTIMKDELETNDRPNKK
jgi:hypothetical protein